MEAIRKAQETDNLGVWAVAVFATQNGPRIGMTQATTWGVEDYDGPFLLAVVEGDAAADAECERQSKLTGVPQYNDEFDREYGFDWDYRPEEGAAE